MINMFVYKIHVHGSERLLAIADAELLGSKFSEGDLDVTISEQFYGSERCTEEKALQLAHSTTIINAMGNNIVNLLTENKIVDKKNIMMIDKVAHAQVVAVV